MVLNNLAMLYKAQGDYVSARPLYERARDIWKATLGEGHLDYAMVLNNLAMLYKEQGDYASARPLLERARDIKKAAVGETHPEYATALNNLAMLYEDQGDYGSARPLYERARDIWKAAVGEGHPDYATALNNLAELYQDQGDYASARPLLERARDIWKATLGEGHPDYAEVLNNLASLYQLQGDYGSARPLYERARDIWKAALGEGHPDYARALNNLASLCLARGAPGEAAGPLADALRITRANLDRYAAALSSRQQLALLEHYRGSLDSYLSALEPGPGSDPAAYAAVAAWKGSLLAGQRRLARLRRAAATGGEAAEALRQWESLTARLARLALEPPPTSADPDAWRRQLAETSREQQEAEVRLNRLGLGQAKEPPAPGAQELAARLPAGAALVDVLQYIHFYPPAAGRGPLRMELCLVAFVLRGGRSPSVVRVELGPVGPVEGLVKDWRKTLNRRHPTLPEQGEKDPAVALRRRLLDPIEPYLEGVDTLLVSPDGPLCRLPLAALPGRDPAKYLVEERAVQVVPVPALLAAAGPREGALNRPSLLAVGEVDYDAEPGRAEAGPAGPAPAAAGPGPAVGPTGSSPSPSTRGEVVAVADSFRGNFRDADQPLVLRKGEPTEEEFRRAAPGRRFLHLATHGYFADPAIPSALTGDRRGSPGGFGPAPVASTRSAVPRRPGGTPSCSRGSPWPGPIRQAPASRGLGRRHPDRTGGGPAGPDGCGAGGAIGLRDGAGRVGRRRRPAWAAARLPGGRGPVGDRQPVGG